MAYSTSWSDVKKAFNPQQWKSVEEFEQYFLQRQSEIRQEPNYYTDKNGVEKVIEPVSHFPELKLYEVWSEGYAATGESGGAILMGKAHARNFSQACHTVMCMNFLENGMKINKPTYKGYVDAGRWDYDPSRLTYWGCLLYWSEELAKKTFG